MITNINDFMEKKEQKLSLITIPNEFEEKYDFQR